MRGARVPRSQGVFAWILVAALLHAGPGQAWAESASEAPVTWKQVGADARYLLTRPAHLDRKGWARVTWTLGIGASLYAVRREVRDAAERNRGADLDRLLQSARKTSLAAVPALALGFALAGSARDSAFDHETSVLVLESLAFSYALGEAGRFVVASRRPEKGEAIDTFSGDGHSVSGDVAAASSLIAPIADRHLKIRDGDGRGRRFWKRLATFGLYGAAGLVAAQRIEADRHWLPDVYFGYLDGLCVGRMLVDSRRGGRGWRDRDGDQPGAGPRVELTPVPAGIVIRWGR